MFILSGRANLCCVFLEFMKAYTVELEAELNQLKEENAQLKHALVLLVRVSVYLFYD